MATIREFFHNGGIYYHNFNLDDDSIALVCLERGKLLTYDNHAVARNNDNVIIGKFSIRTIDSIDYWVFIYTRSDEFIKCESTCHAESLLSSEVEISKRYIDSLENTL